mmetsp:Transcript_38743/g.99079  ORF Transcript_38743/g.99079 Transcript_38743/m.99079 type:complete len:98 (-) Transcript_38743:219-512(-)|eukprot:jgi/Tetstr1/442305/TSEL_030446.t1
MPLDGGPASVEALVHRKHNFVRDDMARNHHSAVDALAAWQASHSEEESALGPALGAPPQAEHFPPCGGEACRAGKRRVCSEDFDFVEESGLEYVGAR